ncbi:hypothetical protein DEU56DRAFT_58322 [Suillus clintonianus]|uniref:uncharacterized protein n=1 Tax=Suillus clintonianus TaxID=1904413 RepID=UPI001B85EBBA|nr:uncharacterized protein DEU56DRAFT_58322 [Suillus clintonianus]KAG2149289.1 hypothetical protein DEU56DRAFT_58322 [Suillus clintonianus]
MGRSDNNISFSKTHPTIRVPVVQHGSFTQPAMHRQNILSLPVSDQLRDTPMRSREYFPPGPPPGRYAQSRGVFTYSNVVDDSSAYGSAGVDSPAHFLGGNSNRYLHIEDSMQPQQGTAFQYPVMDAPSYHEGNAGYALRRVQHPISPADVGVSASSADIRYGLDDSRPAQVPGGIPDRNLVIANPVPRQDTGLQPFPPYGSRAIAWGYEDDIRHAPQSQTAESFTPTVLYDPAHRHLDHSPYDLTPPHPLPSSSSSIPASRTETSNPSAHQPTPFVDHTIQAVSFRNHDAQQPGSQVFLVDGCLIDLGDLPDQGTNDGSITIGRCLRSDSPCGLWVRADKGTIKRHAQRWHGVARGGDTSKVSCTWTECNTEMQKSAVPRHTLCKHFREAFQCNGCSRLFTRGYSWRSHAEKCASGVYGYSVRYCASTRVISVKGVSTRQVGHL